MKIKSEKEKLKIMKNELTLKGNTEEIKLKIRKMRIQSTMKCVCYEVDE